MASTMSSKTARQFIAPTVLAISTVSSVASADAPTPPPTHSSVVAERFVAELPWTVSRCRDTPRYFAVPEVFKENIEIGMAMQAIDDAVAGTNLPIYGSGGANVVSRLTLEDVMVPCKRKKTDGSKKLVMVPAEREVFVAIAGFDYYCSTVESCPPVPVAPTLQESLEAGDGIDTAAAAGFGFSFVGPDPDPPANDLTGWLQLLADQSSATASGGEVETSYWHDGLGFDMSGMHHDHDTESIPVVTSSSGYYGEVSEHCQKHPMLVECGGTGTIDLGVPQTRRETDANAMMQGYAVCRANTGAGGCSGNITQWSYYRHDDAFGVDERVIAQKNQMIYLGNQSYR